VNRAEIGDLLGELLPVADPPYDAPSNQSWAQLQHRINGTFPSEFVDFMDAMAGFEFPGDIFNISEEGRTNGNDTIFRVYEIESQQGEWPPWLIPFYGIGNGDYFGLDLRIEGKSEVYYWYHDRLAAEKYSASFEEWLRGLKSFLS